MRVEEWGELKILTGHSPHLLLSSGSFNMALLRANFVLKENACTAGYGTGLYQGLSLRLAVQGKNLVEFFLTRWLVRDPLSGRTAS